MVSKISATIVKVGVSTYILIPSKFKEDSQFPFSLEENLILRIKDKTLVIERTTTTGEENDLSDTNRNK